MVRPTLQAEGIDGRIRLDVVPQVTPGGRFGKERTVWLWIAAVRRETGEIVILQSDTAATEAEAIDCAIAYGLEVTERSR